MSKPIRPTEIVQKKQEAIPSEVIDVFNEFIAERWNGHSSKFRQKDIVPVIVKRLNQNILENYTSEDLFRRHWMDVEDIYRKAGWEVKYDKPGYCESYDATFEFRKPTKRDGAY
jgi:hypothetical protein